MTELELFNQDIHEVKLGGRTVESAHACYLYYMHTGRNAWHSTWVMKYYKRNCMNLCFEDAKQKAEADRVQGSVFYISQLPSVMFQSGQIRIFVTEINSSFPLSGYSLRAQSLEIPSDSVRINGARNCYLVEGAPLLGVALSFRPDSRFWRVRPAPRNSVIILYSESSRETELIERPIRRSPLEWKSSSSGPTYFLGWNLSKNGNRVTARGVNGVLKLANLDPPDEPRPPRDPSREPSPLSP